MLYREELEDVKRSIRATLISSPYRRLTVRELIASYEQLGNDEIPFRKFGYNSVHEFLLTIPDTVKVLDRGNRNSLVEPVTTAETNHVARLVNGQKSPKRKRSRDIRFRRPSPVRIYPPISRSPTLNSVPSFTPSAVNDGPLIVEPQKEIPTELVCRLVKLLATNTSKCLQSGNLFEEYQRLYQEQLVPEELGFKSEAALLEELERKFPFNCEMNPDVSSLQQSGPASLFPPEVCDEDFDFEPDFSVERLDKGDRFNVVIGEVFSLDEFYVTFLARLDSLKSMMADLNEFYKINGDKYKIPIALVTADLYCVCPFSENFEWHRARIINFSPTLKQAKVCFIDYGTVELVNMYKLRFLHWTFTRHLPFAVLAKLTGIRPIRGDAYERYVNEKFLSLYGNCDLEAEVVRKMPHCVEIYLRTLEDEPKKLVHEDLIFKRLGRPTHNHLMFDEKSKRIISQFREDIWSQLAGSNEVSKETQSKSPSAASKLPQITPKPSSNASTPSPRLPRLPMLFARKPSSSASTPSPPVSSPLVQQFPTSPLFYNPMMTSYPYSYPFPFFGPWAGAPQRMQNFFPPTFPLTCFRNPAYIQPYMFPSAPRPQYSICYPPPSSTPPVMKTEPSSGPSAPLVARLKSPLPITPAPQYSICYPQPSSTPPVMKTEPSSGPSAPLVARLKSPLPITPAPPAYCRDHVEVTSGTVRSDESDPAEGKDSDESNPVEGKDSDESNPVEGKDNTAHQQPIEEETVSKKLEKILEKYLDVDQSLPGIPSLTKHRTPRDYEGPDEDDVLRKHEDQYLSDAVIDERSSDTILDYEAPNGDDEYPSDDAAVECSFDTLHEYEAYDTNQKAEEIHQYVSDDVVDGSLSDSKAVRHTSSVSPTTALNAEATEFIPRGKAVIVSAETDASVVDAPSSAVSGETAELAKNLKELRAYVVKHVTSLRKNLQQTNL